MYKKFEEEEIVTQKIRATAQRHNKLKISPWVLKIIRTDNR